jgi:thioredoxin 1
MENTNISALSHDDFDEFIDNDQIVVVYFWAPWCEPCHQFKDIYKNICDDKGYSAVKFASVNIEDEEALGQDFNIRSVPTIIIFREKVALSVESGVLTQKDLEELLDQAKSLDMKAVHEKIAKDMLQ